MSDYIVTDKKCRGAEGFYLAAGKRAFDLILVLLALPALLFIFAILIVLTMLDGHAPFYCQERVGLHGKAFKMFKFRTMVVDADAQLERHLAENPAARMEWDVKQKLTKDPRITWVGTFLRKSSMDELPQLLNVLFGEMSLIGPRPMMTNQTSLYHGKAYYLMRPGLSGPWQVSDRNLSSFSARVDLDDNYYREVSFKSDCDILRRTVSTVLKGSGC
jgi:exopolysaccharide production protein ExoY